eukprot:g3534.t1
MSTELSISSDMWTEDYVWIVVIGAFAAFFAAFGIGANDVANAFATSVGAKSITIGQAVILAAIFEFAGALFLGSNVMETVRKDIADPDCFQHNPALLMHGMMCALFAVGFWLLAASYLKMPVSTTHSIVGAIVGMALSVTPDDCVVWYKEKDDWPYVGGVSGIVLSWVVAPCLSYVFAAILFLSVRQFVLRADNSYNRAFYVYPILVFITTFTLTLFILFKGAKGKDVADDLGDTEAEQDAYGALIAAITASVIVAVFVPVGLPILRRRIDKEFSGKQKTTAATSASTADVVPKDVELGKVASNTDDDVASKGAASSDAVGQAKKYIEMMAKDVLTIDDATTQEIHDNAEVFDEKTEALFKYIQIFTVCCDAFAHGANDVANSIGPFAAIYVIYKTGVVSDDSELGDDAYWILAFGGVGIVLGLALYGYKIIQVLGTDMAKMTPSRGFAIELGAVAVIIMGSRLGIPLSTTHCQVGATCGVAHAEGRKGVNYKTLGVVIFGWVATLVVAGCTSALFTALGAYAPSKRNRGGSSPHVVARRNVAGPAHLKRFDSADFFSNRALRELDIAARDAPEEVKANDDASEGRKKASVSLDPLPDEDYSEFSPPKRRSYLAPPSPTSSSTTPAIATIKTRVVDERRSQGPSSQVATKKGRVANKSNTQSKRRSCEGRFDLRKSLGRQATERRLRAAVRKEDRRVSAHRVAERQLLGPSHLRRFDSADFFSKKALQELADAVDDEDDEDKAEMGDM